MVFDLAKGVSDFNFWKSRMESEQSPTRTIYISLLVLTFLLYRSYSSIAFASTLPGPVFSVRTISLHGRSFDLHLANPQPVVPPEILVLYASGDGGWYGAASNMFKGIAALGYPVVGFSTRSYMKLLGYGNNPATVEELTQDYQDIIEQARRILSLPSSVRTILTGWSRGAAFAVLAASEKKLQPELAGVLAIGLPGKEELKIRHHGKKIYLNQLQDSKQQILFDTYEQIPEIAPLPCALIQSTGDNFLPASSARILFGAQSGLKHFYGVEARNHRFSGGWTSFLSRLQESLEWMSRVNPGGPSFQTNP